MSCSQITAEFSSEKFRLIFKNPHVFGVWRYTCCPTNRSFHVYRVLIASLFILLLILDFFWIIGFAGAGESNRISACLDATQLSLIALTLSYFLLSCTAFQWLRLQWEPDGDKSLTYKPGWWLYTCSVNAVFACMIIFWVYGGASSPSLEQKLKNSIPGILILFDLCLSSIPLCLCHAIYVCLVYWCYLAVVALALFLTYFFGPAAARNRVGPATPTVWVGGSPLLPNGYADFSDPHRIASTVLGSIAMAVLVHCVLLSVVITRDFFASLFHRSTELRRPNLLAVEDTAQLYTQRSSSVGQTTPVAEPASASGTTNKGFVDP